MTYFIDPYTKYYENLKDASGMSSGASTASDSVSSLGTNSTNLTSGITASQWQEIGASEVINTIIPGLTTLLSKLSSDLSSTLSVAVSKASELGAKAEELKEKDEKYEAAKKELDELKSNEPTKYDEDYIETDAHKAWKTKVTEKEDEVKKLETECKNLQGEADGIAGEINALEVSKAEEVTVNVGTGTQAQSTDMTVLANDGRFVKLNYSGSTWNVINTKKISVVDFVKFIQQHGLNQTSHQAKYGNECLGVAYAYSNRLYNKNPLYTNMDSFYSGAYTMNNNKAYETTNKQAMLGVVYDELMAGRPCVVQVTTKAGHRHFATCVGMKSTVTSRDTIKEEDLLIIDSWDGKLEAMDGSITSDRHLFANNQGEWFVGRLKQGNAA